MIPTMSPRTKSVLMLLGAVLLGAVIGALIHARVVEKRFERIEYIRTERGFMRDVERVIVPENEEQRTAVRRVLKDAARRLQNERREMRQEVQSILDSTRGALDTLLTDDQMERLDRHVRMKQHERRRRGPR